jgi:hypothetical protein
LIKGRAMSFQILFIYSQVELLKNTMIEKAEVGHFGRTVIVQQLWNPILTFFDA